MELNTWMNLDVITKNPTRFYGELSDVLIRDHKISEMIIRYGSILSSALFFSPDSILMANENAICLEKRQDIRHLEKKNFERYSKGSISYQSLPVQDCNGTVFAKVNDLWFDSEFRITDYILSRSFFDDLDYGYLVISSDLLHYDAQKQRLIYAYDKERVEKSPYQSGLVQKIFSGRGV